MKAVIKSFVLVLATGSLAVAQPVAPVMSTGSVPAGTSLGSAEDEAVHRQNDRIEARAKLDQARDAEFRKDLFTAAKLYDDAWALADRVGPLADAERQMAVAGIASVRMQLAHDAQHRGDYDEASRQVGDVLRVDPRNPIAVQFNTINNGFVERNRGMTPSPVVLDRVKQVHQENIETLQLIQDGKVLYQIGKNEEAELKFQEALDRDPNNQSALYYLSLCKQIRDRQVKDAANVTSMNRMVKVEKGWADNDARL
jgi:tetratricopeptide (TPR) repeat protein